MGRLVRKKEANGEKAEICGGHARFVHDSIRSNESLLLGSEGDTLGSINGRLSS
jgi:hypothetical protein